MNMDNDIITILKNIIDTSVQTESDVNCHLLEGLTHQIATPSTLLSYYLETLQNKNPSDEYIALACKELGVLQRIFLLTEMAFLIEKQPLSKKNLSIVSVSSLLESLCQSSGFQDYDIKKDFCILADTEIMNYILKILFDKAKNHNNGKNPDSIKLFSQNNNVVIEIKDKGIGIDILDAKNMTSKYYRTALSKKQGMRGAGMSLYIIEKFIIFLNGKIYITKNKTKGITVSLSFPLRNSL
jgi:signal transduction histidine kinase